MEAPTTSQTILLVDDEQLFRESASEVLRAAFPEKRVLTAADGGEAIIACIEHEIDVVVTDLNLPVKSGVEVLEELDRIEYPAPVIVITAVGTPEVVDRIKRLGAFGFLEKPVDQQRLIATVRAATDGRGVGGGLSIAEFSELIATEGESGLLRVSRRDKVAQLVFQDGVLLDAEVDGIRGDRAAIEILAWGEESRMRMLPDIRPTRQTVSTSLETLILRGVEEGRRARTTTPAAGEASAATNQVRNQQVKETGMSNVKDSLKAAMGIDGAIGVALVDHESGMALGQAGGGDRINLDVAGAGNTEVIRAKLKVMNNLQLNEGIEDILITLSTQYHLIRPLEVAPNLFLYLALDREKSNLAMARHKLSTIEKQLAL